VESSEMMSSEQKKWFHFVLFRFKGTPPISMNHHHHHLSPKKKVFKKCCFQKKFGFVQQQRK
jgi:hypothetical protein